MATTSEWHAHSRQKLESGRPVGPACQGACMDRIIKANIERFKLLLETETDPTKRAMEIRLLAEEEAKQVSKPEKR